MRDARDGKMPLAMATSSAAPTPHRQNGGDGVRSASLVLGPRWRDQLLGKHKRRPLLRAPTTNNTTGHHRHAPNGDGSRLSDSLAQFAHHQSPRGLALQRAPASLFRRYEAFPESRYRMVQRYREAEQQGARGCPHAMNNPIGQRSARKALSFDRFVAYDAIHKLHVLLTFVPKAAASVWQIDHVRRVMQTLARGAGFQRLLEIWELDAREDGQESAPSWVFVQDFHLTWIPLDLYCDASEFSESTLRHVTFDVVSMVHFLHTHNLSASGQLCANQDFMVNVDTQRVVWLVSPALVLSGLLLAHATSGRCARDVSSIGYLMFHLTMVPHATTLLDSTSDINELEKEIRDELTHLSLPCRAMMISCLTETPTIEELIKRKWLRQIEFISTVPKLDNHLVALQPHKRLVLQSLLWKLATFFVRDWLGSMHALGAAPSATATSLDEEEVENPRRSRKAASKRQYVGRHVSVSHNYNHHHFPTGGRAGSNLLMRGMVIVPPLGTAILPNSDDDAELKYRSGELSNVQPRSFELRGHVTTLLPGAEQALFEISANVASERKMNYDSFGYDFPASPLSASSQLEYDTFEDRDDDIFAVEASALDEEILEDGEGRRGRVGSLLLHENGHNHSMHSVASISDLRNVVRSLHPNLSHTGSDERAELHQFDAAIQARAFSKDGLDPVHLSAFGPKDISFRDTFRVDIWAYLRQQRREMLETALEMNESEVAQRVQPMQIARGTLITISIEPNDRVSVLGEECKSFRWRGEVNGVSFEMQHKKTNRRREQDDDSEALCIARIVAGTKVSLLFIRLRGTAVTLDDDASTPAPLSTRLEHLVADVPDIPANSLEPVRPIGKGAFGEAMLAVWKERNTHVVIKSPHRDAFQADSDALEDFRHEAAVMQMLGKHPHVVELLGITSPDRVTDDISAIVVEYLPNGSLHDFLTASSATDAPKLIDMPSAVAPLSLFSRTVMARDAAHGIVNIHQGHVLHRDIAARNCLLDEHFRVKVCDFGMSRLSSKANCLFFDDEHHGFGPIKWMAPESVLPPHLFSTHSDSYMFGVLMYEIFSGQLPFPGLPSRDAMALILEGQHVPIPDYLPQTHKNLMKSCFDPHPLARPSMDQIFMTLDQWIVQDTRYHSRVPIGIL